MESALEISFGFRYVWLRRFKSDFTGDAINLSLTPSFLARFDPPCRFNDMVPSVVKFPKLRIAPSQS